MGHEEIIEPAGVEVDDHGPDIQQPLIVEAVEDVEVVNAVEDSRPVPAPTNAPDFYAVGVRLIKMSPVWLLTVTCGFALLILLLSWVRPGGGEADAASIPNDAKSVAVQSTQAPNAPASSTETHAPAVDAHREIVAETHPAEATQVATQAPAPVESTPAEQPKEPARVVTPAGDAGGKFTVQVGSFNVESQANERISSLRAVGFDARSTVVEIPGRGTWYRVQVGRFVEREEAAKTAAQLRDKGAAAGSMVVAVQE